jgi:hypothetical protein
MKKGYFNSTPDEREAYTIVIPPPNVTGVLHMGHMLNNTLQDVMVRRARMMGFNACWVPGTDHASIATEAKVVRKLRESGIKKSDLSSNQLKSIKSDLTVNPYVVGDFGNGNEKRFSLYMESPNSIYIPRFYAYQEFGKPDNYKMDEGHDIKIRFNGSLRPEQLPLIDLYRVACEEKGGGLISLKCGGGKTVLALYIISLLKKKTIVIVHKDFLMTQWRDRIQQFLPEARIGKIQQNTIDIENKDIVLAMVQSLSQKEYDQSVFSSFGLAIFDECHHLGAEVFSKSMAKVASKYMLGLSATPDRKDGLRKVFEW